MQTVPSGIVFTGKRTDAPVVMASVQEWVGVVSRDKYQWFELWMDYNYIRTLTDRYVHYISILRSQWDRCTFPRIVGDRWCATDKKGHCQKCPPFKALNVIDIRNCIKCLANCIICQLQYKQYDLQKEICPKNTLIMCMIWHTHHIGILGIKILINTIELNKRYPNNQD